MFHGPAFAGVTKIDCLADNGIAGVLTPLPAPGALLDSAGQLIGHWMQVSLTVDQTVLPTGIEQVSFHGPVPTGDVHCTAWIRSVTAQEMVADAELTVNGELWCRITGWTTRRFTTDDRIWQVKLRPGTEMLSTKDSEWLKVQENWSDSATRDLIMRRYLAHQREFVATAVSRLAEVDDRPEEALDSAMDTDVEASPVMPPLAIQRQRAVLSALHAEGAARVVDLGCGEGALLRELIRDTTFSEILGVDVSPRALQIVERRLNLARMPDSQRARLRLIQSSVTYRDDRLSGYDAVVLMEVIEHLDPARLPALESTVFAHARPRTVVVTTPNVEHNIRFVGMPAGTMRHRDHRFEWTRAEFSGWATTVCESHGYDVTFTAVGEDDPDVGAPTQMAVFRRVEARREAS